MMFETTQVKQLRPSRVTAPDATMSDGRRSDLATEPKEYGGKRKINIQKKKKRFLGRGV